MASVQFQPNITTSDDGNERSLVYGSDMEDEDENIPYHAREHARPFTYGNIPEGFKHSELNHVTIEEVLDEPKVSRNVHAVLPPSPSTQRKSTRPSISSSRPVLRKTPTRQEFEEMLNERREQAMREQNNTATKLAQSAAIQKDLDELQEILNKKCLQDERNKFTTSHAKNMNLTEVHDCKESNSMSTCDQNEQALQIVEQRRSETPSFPVAPKQLLDGRCISPYPMSAPETPISQRFQALPSNEIQIENTICQQEDVLSGSVANDTHEVAPHLVKFAKDSSEFWYKPHMTREDAVSLLRNTSPGSFIVRNSTTYKNAYGLVMRVSKPPPGVIVPENSCGDELVRHFLLEPTTRGVRLKGCANEPIFTSLSALVYQHSINQLALPSKLIIPDRDLLQSLGDIELVTAQKQLLRQGAACNVLYLFSCDMESLTGDEAIRKAVNEMFTQQQPLSPIEVHLKVSEQGITLTDNTRSIFFRRHYAPQNISHFANDPDNHFWSVSANDEGIQRAVNKTIFAFVARPLTGARDNQCHVFCDLATTQPASAIVSFANKVLPMDKQNHKML